METFSNEEIKDIQSIIKNIQKLYGFSEFKGFEITQDKKLINERDKMDKQMEKLILENLEYFIIYQKNIVNRCIEDFNRELTICRKMRKVIDFSILGVL
ncbi:MAG: hypothetical protein V8Q92_06480 [Coprococcus comes]